LSWGAFAALPPGAPVCDRLTTYDDRTRLLLSNRFAGMDAQSRLQADASERRTVPGQWPDAPGWKLESEGWQRTE